MAAKPTSPCPAQSRQKDDTMPHAKVNGHTLYYEETGSGPETIVFAHGLLWSGRMFDAQVRALKDRYRCITFDFLGQGRSEIARDGYDMVSVAADAAALVKQLKAAPCHFAGLSMGGFVGMRMGIHFPELVRSLILLETSADPEPPENLPRYRLLSFISRWISVRLVVGQIMPIMFGQTFLKDPARQKQRDEWRGYLLANNQTGIARAVRGVIERQGVYEMLGKIKTPTLVIVGEQAVATVPAKAERIAAAIPGAKLVRIPDAGHTSTVEEPAAVNAAIAQFLLSLSR
jgi:pimeloyl-ACP methyl ester carboxylesterase